MRVPRSRKAAVERRWRRAHIESKTHTKSVLALGRLISFGFRRKRHQAEACDTPLTSTPTTTISATGGRAFSLAVQDQPRILYRIRRCRSFAARSKSIPPFTAVRNSARGESPQFVCARTARGSIVQPLSDCYTPVANRVLSPPLMVLSERRERLIHRHRTTYLCHSMSRPRR
jgi:hypothetical protein